MLGLSHEEITSRVANLSEEECRNIVSAFSQLQVGGEEQISARTNNSFETWMENFVGGLEIIIKMLVYLALICVMYEAGFFDESSEPEY
jgi:phage-related protein